jgi:hypothetical protein
MNNLKIKTYSLRKSQAVTGGGLLSPTGARQLATERKRDSKDFKNSSLSKDRAQDKEKSEGRPIKQKEATSTNSHIPNSLLNEVNKIIKTPALNISSKLDSKGSNILLILLLLLGNRSININFFDKHVINSIDTKNSKDSKIMDQELNEKKYIDTERGLERDKSEKNDVNEKNEKNINIKLNINSEVINNNIKIKNKNDINSLNNLNSMSGSNPSCGGKDNKVRN